MAFASVTENKFLPSKFNMKEQINGEYLLCLKKFTATSKTINILLEKINKLALSFQMNDFRNLCILAVRRRLESGRSCLFLNFVFTTREW